MSPSAPDRPAAPAGPGWRRNLRHPWAALKYWKDSSLANRLTLAVLLGAAGMLAVVGGSSYLAMSQLLQKNIETDLAGQLATLGEKVEDQLNHIDRVMAGAAKSSFVANALTDTSDRDIYLAPFLRDQKAHAPRLSSLALVDFRGELIARDREGGGAGAWQASPTVLAALTGGRPLASLREVEGGTVLEVVRPVFFAPTRSVEGAVVGILPLVPLFQSVTGDLPPRFFHQLRGVGGMVVPSDWARPPQDLFALNRPLELPSPLNDLGLTMVLGEDRKEIFAPLTRVVDIYLVSAALLLGLGYLMASILGKRLAAPIIALSREAAAISEGGGEQGRLETSGRDEIATMTRAIATMVEKLSQARTTLQGKVRERTEELRASKVLLDNIVENIPHAVAVRDLHHGGEVVLWNRAAEGLFGIDRALATASAAPLLESWFVDGHGLGEIPAPGETWDATRTFSPSGEGLLLHLQTRVLTLADRTGRPGHLLVIADDITSRRQAEETTQLERIRFEVLYQLSQMVQDTEAAIKDFALQESVRITGSRIGYLFFLDESEQTLKLHAWTGEVMSNCRVEKAPTEFLVADTGLWGEAVRQRRPIITNDYAADNPWKKGLPEGHLALTRHLNVPLIDAGKIVVLVGVGNKDRDYDEADVRHLTLLINGMWRALQRKWAEQSLRSSETNFRVLSQQFLALLAGIPDRIILLDPNLQVVWSNREGGGYAMGSRRHPRQEQKLCYQLWDDSAEICAGCPSARCFASGQPEQGQMESPGGRTFDLRAIPIRNEQGVVVNVIELAQDISDRIRAQEQSIRTAHLASLGELAAGVAHEINNPINGIINYAQILADRLQASPETADLAGRIICEGERISDIVRHLLSLAHSGGGGKKPVDLAEELQEVLGLTATQLRDDHIECRLEIDPGLPRVFANSGQLRQVFLNIINNARYALNERFAGTHPDKILEVRVSLVSGTPERVRLAFIDHGIGIPAGILDRVMNPFFTTKPVGKGTGLGLSISHGIIADHQGNLKLESVEGHGTRVRIDLPIPTTEE